MLQGLKEVEDKVVPVLNYASRHEGLKEEKRK
jgi:hypothetical protein